MQKLAIPSYEAFAATNPLVRFSVYTHIQVNALKALADEIRKLLDQSIHPQQVNCVPLMDAQGKFWLWVLGAFEVVRTMYQYRKCFSPAAADRIKIFKDEIAQIRVPFAKQEYAGYGGPIDGECSISGIDDVGRDFSHTVRGKVINVRPLLDEFEVLIASITPVDVAHSLKGASRSGKTR
jgi:hypothetical protein